MVLRRLLRWAVAWSQQYQQPQRQCLEADAALPCLMLSWQQQRVLLLLVVL
jgi:hypothetical protein